MCKVCNEFINLFLFGSEYQNVCPVTGSKTIAFGCTEAGVPQKYFNGFKEGI